MIKALQPLGAKNIIHIIAAYENNDVTLTITATPKDEKGKPQTLQLSGPVDEVEAALPHELLQGVTAVTRFQSNLADLEASQTKAIEEAKAKPATAPAAPAKAKKQEKPKADPQPEKKEEPAPTTGSLDLAGLLDAATKK